MGRRQRGLTIIYYLNFLFVFHVACVWFVLMVYKNLAQNSACAQPNFIVTC